MNAIVNTNITAYKNAAQSQHTVDLAKSIAHVVSLTAIKKMADNDDCRGRLIYAAEQLGDVHYEARLITEKQDLLNQERIDNAITMLYLLADAFQCCIQPELISSMFQHIHDLLDSVTFNMNLSGVAA